MLEEFKQWTVFEQFSKRNKSKGKQTYPKNRRAGSPGRKKDVGKRANEGLMDLFFQLVSGRHNSLTNPNFKMVTSPVRTSLCLKWAFKTIYWLGGAFFLFTQKNPPMSREGLNSI